MANVFLCYRRADSAPYTGRLYDALAQSYGVSQVFMDVNAIPPGGDFAELIRKRISRTDAVLVIIGSRWLESIDSDGETRLHSVDDPVRREIQAALDSDARIIPVLVASARMPSASELPQELVRLADYNAVELRDSAWSRDITELLRHIGQSAAEWNASRRAVVVMWFLCVGLPLCLGVIIWLGIEYGDVATLTILPFAVVVFAMIKFLNRKYPLPRR